jgi:hypothetical protein
MQEAAGPVEKYRRSPVRLAPTRTSSVMDLLLPNFLLHDPLAQAISTTDVRLVSVGSLRRKRSICAGQWSSLPAIITLLTKRPLPSGLRPGQAVANVPGEEGGRGWWGKVAGMKCAAGKGKISMKHACAAGRCGLCQSPNPAGVQRPDRLSSWQRFLSLTTPLRSA